MQDRIRKQTKYLTVSAMFSALGVVFLMLGSLIEVLDISVAVLASLLTVYAVIEMGRAYPWLIWLVTSVLSLLLLPQKTPALFYTFFAGFYPILKEKLERLKPLASYFLKLIVFHLCLGAMVAVMFLFIPDALEINGMKWLPVALYLGSLACFVLYDFALTKIITYYLIRLRKRFGIK